MNDQGGHRQITGNGQPLRTFVHGHRKSISVLTAFLIAGAIVIPYATASTAEQTNANQSTRQDSEKAQTMNPGTERVDGQKMHNDSSGNSNQTNVTVNGQAVEVPANGSYHNVTEDSNGRTEVKVESSQSSSGNGSTNSNSSSVNVNVTSESQSGSPD